MEITRRVHWRWLVSWLALTIFCGAARFSLAAEPDELQPEQKQQQAIKDRQQSVDNLKQIALAMLNYVSVHKTYPPAFNTAEPQGPAPNAERKPLLSWRVLILPYLGEAELYKQFKLDEPCDSKDNIKLIKKMPAVYKAPGSSSVFKTVYLTPRGENTVFPGEKAIRIKDVTDGTSKTIMVVEASEDNATVWTKPDDFEIDEHNPIAGLIGLRDGVFLAAFCDGSVHTIPKAVGSETLMRLFIRNDGHAVNVP